MKQIISVNQLAIEYISSLKKDRHTRTKQQSSLLGTDFAMCRIKSTAYKLIIQQQQKDINFFILYIPLNINALTAVYKANQREEGKNRHRYCNK